MSTSVLTGSPGVGVFEGEGEAVVDSCQLDDGILYYHPVGVLRHAIGDDEPLKLQLELTVGVFRQRLRFKPAQPEIGILVSVDEELEGADLVEEQQIVV
ncbi:hypothetical protein EYF80_020298 [Liparis tanakae]|uniref:Uncharacterized protein n=1 Tax=Liparis tanakae TaxID=230148 RepID=A0A4Z2HWS6_9TELE|nr:hypothetical protein EYF80_020298 [Liparis tanakae]